MVNKKGRFVFIEGDSLPFIDCTQEEMIDQRLDVIYDQVPEIRQATSQALKGKTREGMIHRNGQTWTYRTYPSRDEHAEITGAVGLAFDVTAQHQRRRRRSAEEQLKNALQGVKSRKSMPEVILEQISDLFQLKNALLIGRPRSSEKYMVEKANNAWAPAQGKELPTDRLSRLAPHIEIILDTGQPLTQVFHTDPITRINDFTFLAGCPLTSEGQTIGLILIGRTDPFTEEEIRLLTSLGDLVGNALMRAAQHERTERRLQRISALHAIDQAITGSFDLEVTLDVLLNQVITQLEIDAVDLYLYNPNLNHLEYTKSRGFRSPLDENQELNAGKGLPWRVIEKRGLINIPDLAACHERIQRPYLLKKEGFQSYYGFPLIAKGEIKGVLEIFHRQQLSTDEEWVDFYQTLAAQAAIAIDNASLVENLRRSNIKLDLAYHATLEGWVRALDLRDKETEGHTQRVTKRTELLGQALGISGEALINLRRGALLHDIGKLGIPDEILNKPGPLNPREWKLMKKHPQYAKDMLSQIEFLHQALVIPAHHHEKWDGTGYPQGLKGKQIPLEARIFAVIDVWDALTSNRPYRKAWREEKAIRYILNQSGSHFDPQIIQAWKEVFEIPDLINSPPVDA